MGLRAGAGVETTGAFPSAADTARRLIYRHWLNYPHEPDEILPSGGKPCRFGIPLSRSARCCFDAFAREHLEREDTFPPIAWR